MEFILNPDGSTAPATGGGPAADDAGLIKDGDTDSFTADVIEGSMQTPVIVDFWAPWCGPCKQLTPALEKAVRHAGGLVKLVKINIDDNQNLAQQLRIQSVPTIFAFKGGRPVDGFAGALPDSQIKAFIDRLLGDSKPPLEAAMEQADAALQSGDADTAQAIYSEIASQEPDNAKALAGIIRSAVALGQAEAAKELIAGLTPEMLRDSDIAAAVTAVELAEQTSGTGNAEIEEARSRLEADPNDIQARYDYAVSLFGGGRTEDAIDELIEVVRRDRNWDDEAGRKQLVKIFEALGFNDPLAQEGRRKLSAILFS